MRSASLFALLVILPALCAAGPFADVSPVEARHVVSVLGAARGGFSGAPAPSIALLKNIDASVAEQRALLAPLRDALDQMYEEGQNDGSAFTRAVRLLTGKTEGLLKDAGREDADAAQLGASVQQLEELRRFVAFYTPADAGAFDASVAKARQAFETKKTAELGASAGAIAAGLSAEAPASAPAAVAAPAAPAASDAELVVMRSYVDDLKGTSDLDDAQEIVDRIEKLAKATRSEAVQRELMRALVADLESSSDEDYLQYVIDAVERIAKASPYLGVRQLAVEGVMDDVKRSSDSDYMNYGVDAVERIAKLDGSEGVRGLAISRLLAEREEWSDEDAREYLRDAVDRIGAAHPGGLAAIGVPAIERQPKQVLEDVQVVEEKDGPSNDISARAALLIKIGVALIGFLAAMRLAPPGLVDKVTGEIVTGAALNIFLFDEIIDRKTDAAIFALFVAGILAATVLAPAGQLVGAIGTIGGAYIIAMLLL